MRFKFVPIIVAALLLTVCIPLVGDSSVDAAPGDEKWINPFIGKIDQQSTVPEGFIGIYTPDDLNKIGTDVDSIYDDPQSPGNKLKWSMEAKYIQMADLDFTGLNLNGGSDVNIIVDSVPHLKIRIQYHDGVSFVDAAGLEVWADGQRVDADAQGAAEFPSLSNTGEYKIVAGGRVGGIDISLGFVIAAGHISSSFVEDSNGNFDPIGTGTNYFQGVYDGNGYRIIGLDTRTYSYEGWGASGLFGLVGDLPSMSKYTGPNYIGNLGIVGGKSVMITSTKSINKGNSYAGSVAGMSKYGIYNCYSDSDVFGAGPSANSGGIAGWCMGRIIQCSNYGNVFATADNSVANAGGISGVSAEYVYYCNNSGSILAICLGLSHNINAGGITGSSIGIGGQITYCQNSGSVTARSTSTRNSAGAGGISGSVEAVAWCINTGDVLLDTSTTSAYMGGAGGIAGIGKIIHSCYSLGNVSMDNVVNSDLYIGGICGYISVDANNHTLNTSYFLEGTLYRDGSSIPDTLCQNLAANHTDDGPGVAVPPQSASGPRTSGELKDPDTYYEWNYGWYLGDIIDFHPQVNNGYPFLVPLISADFSVQPVSRTVNVSDSVSFSVAADSIYPLSYQWQKDTGSGWTDIPSATSSTYSISSASLADNGTQFRCLVYNIKGTLASDAATLTVTPMGTVATINYDPNGGAGSIPFVTGNIGTGVTISDGTGFTKNGYTITGWSETPGGAKKYSLGEVATFTTTMTLYAIWEANDHVISFHAGDGTGSATINCNYDDVISLHDGVGFTKTGYRLIGWSATQGSSTYEYGLGDSYTVSGDKTLYAVWAANDHTVIFDAGDGTGTTSMNCCYGDAINLHDGTGFAKDGHQLAGWSKTQGAASHDYELGCNYSISGDEVFYAVWAPVAGPVVSGEHDDCWACLAIQVIAIVLAILAALVFVYSVALWIRSRNKE